MSRMFDEMPEELKMLLGIGSISTDLTGEKEKTREEDFDFENPPLTCPDIPDSIVSAEAIKKMAEARKLMLLKFVWHSAVEVTLLRQDVQSRLI